MELPLVLTSKLVPILDIHHVPMSAHEGYILVKGTDVQLQALGYRNPQPSGAGIQLDVGVRSQSLLRDRTLVESCFEGGEDLDDAIEKALYAFCLESLHTILAVFVDRRLGENQVEWESWRSGERAWEVCLGPITPKVAAGAEEVKIPDYGSFLGALREAYLREASHELHWLRVYRGSLHGECIAREVLLDNEEWQTGQDILDHWQWPAEPDFYSIREFMIAVPAVQQKKRWKFW